MNAAAQEQFESFLKHLHHLSQHSSQAYRRDIKHLQNFCEQQQIQDWAQLDGRMVRGFEIYRQYAPSIVI